MPMMQIKAEELREGDEIQGWDGHTTRMTVRRKVTSPTSDASHLIFDVHTHRQGNYSIGIHRDTLMLVKLPRPEVGW